MATSPCCPSLSTLGKFYGCVNGLSNFVIVMKLNYHLDETTVSIEQGFQTTIFIYPRFDGSCFLNVFRSNLSRRVSISIQNLNMTMCLVFNGVSCFQSVYSGHSSLIPVSVVSSISSFLLSPAFLFFLLTVSSWICISFFYHYLVPVFAGDWVCICFIHPSK